MLALTIRLLVLIGVALAIPEPAREPWATSDDYFKVVEKGFRFDSMPHHVHFVEKGKFAKINGFSSRQDSD